MKKAFFVVDVILSGILTLLALIFMFLEFNAAFAGDSALFESPAKGFALIY